MADQQRLNQGVAILNQLHDHLALAGKERPWEGSGNKAADEFVGTDAFAFLLAVIADYHIPAERAWSFPYELSRVLGQLSPAHMATMTPATLEQAVRQTPQKHRYPATIAKWYIAASEKIIQNYASDAANVWRGRNVSDTLLHLLSFKGIGQKKASMAVNILSRDLRWITPAETEFRFIDVSFDVHIRRVFLRVGFADADTPDAILGAARRLNPAYPRRLDLGSWHVGRTWCHPTSPRCGTCPLEKACAYTTPRMPPS